MATKTAPVGTGERTGTQGRPPSRWRSLIERSFKPGSLIPVVLLFLLLTVLPVLSVGRMAVSTIELAGGEQTWTLNPQRNVNLLLNDPVFRAALVNTAIFVAVNVAVQVVLGFILALAVSRLTKGKGIMRTIMMLPILVPPVAIGSMWRLLYEYEFGPFNTFLRAVGLDPIDWLGSPGIALWSIIIVDIWHWTPFVFLLMLAGIESLPQELMEAAEVDGAKHHQMIRWIMLPLLIPTIWVVVIFRAITAFRVFDEVLLLTSGGPGTATEVVSLYVYKVFFEQLRFGYGALLALVSVVLLLLGLWALRRAQKLGGGRSA